MHGRPWPTAKTKQHGKDATMCSTSHLELRASLIPVDVFAKHAHEIILIKTSSGFGSALWMTSWHGNPRYVPLHQVPRCVSSLPATPERMHSHVSVLVTGCMPKLHVSYPEDLGLENRMVH